MRPDFVMASVFAVLALAGVIGGVPEAAIGLSILALICLGLGVHERLRSRR